MKVSFSNFRRG